MLIGRGPRLPVPYVEVEVPGPPTVLAEQWRERVRLAHSAAIGLTSAERRLVSAVRQARNDSPRNPRLTTVYAVAAALNVSPGWLIGDEWDG